MSTDKDKRNVTTLAERVVVDIPLAVQTVTTNENKRKHTSLAEIERLVSTDYGRR